MAKDETKKKAEVAAQEAATSLAEMLGTGDTIAELGLHIRPLKLKEVQEFINDNVAVGTQVFGLVNEENRKILDKWLQRCVSKGGEPYSLEKAMNDDMDLVQLRHVIEKLVDLSG